LTDDDISDLSIGSVLGDYNPVTKGWLDVIQRLQRDVMAARGSFVGPLALNLVYFVDGKHGAVDFEGVRAGRSELKIPRLMVQAAVPAGPAPANARSELLRLLDSAIDLATEWARRKKIADDLPEIRSIAEAVKMI
jgi:hypothetical protein